MNKKDKAVSVHCTIQDFHMVLKVMKNISIPMLFC